MKRYVLLLLFHPLWGGAVPKPDTDAQKAIYDRIVKQEAAIQALPAPDTDLQNAHVAVIKCYKSNGTCDKELQALDKEINHDRL